MMFQSSLIFRLQGNFPSLTKHTSTSRRGGEACLINQTTYRPIQLNVSRSDNYHVCNKTGIKISHRVFAVESSYREHVPMCLPV